MKRDPAVYIMVSGFHGTIYTGVTSNLLQRIHQHREGSFGGFTGEYGCKRLVWFEMGGSMDGAISREKQLKNWHRGVEGGTNREGESDLAGLSGGFRISLAHQEGGPRIEPGVTG